MTAINFKISVTMLKLKYRKMVAYALNSFNKKNYKLLKDDKLNLYQICINLKSCPWHIFKWEQVEVF